MQNRLRHSGLGLGSALTITSLRSYWTRLLYDAGDTGLSKWDITNPETTVAEFESLNGINMYNLNAFGTNNYSNNIKSKKTQASGCWVFSHLDIPVKDYPTSYRRAGLINSANTAGIEFLRDAAGDESVLSLRIFTASTQRYLVATTAKDLGIFKITISTDHKINVYLLVNGVWVQQGTEQTWDVGEVAMFLSTKGAANTFGISKATLRDIFIDTEDKGYYLQYLNKINGHSTSSGIVLDGVTDNTLTINSILSAGSDVYIAGGDCLMSGSIVIPSNRDVYLKNVRIKMDDDSIDNFFRNSDMTNGNTNIHIYGQGNVVLDGNSENNDDWDGTQYPTYGPAGPGVASATLYRYMSIPFGKVNNFSIAGLNFVDYNHWSVVFQQTSNGTISDVFYNYMYVNTNQANKDGIACLNGCHDIVVSNIRGKTQDDYLLVGSSRRAGYRLPIPDWEVGNTYNITFEDINCYYTGYYAVRVGGEGNEDNKVHNVIVSNFHVYQCSAFIHVGLDGYYESAPTQSTLYGFTFDDVTVDINIYTSVLIITEACLSFIFTDFVNNSGKSDLAITAGKDVNNFVVNGVVYLSPVVSSATVEDANKNKVVITFSDNLDTDYIPETNDFVLDGKTISDVSISGAIMTLTVSVDYAYGDIITVDYTKPASNQLRDTYGAEVATFADQAVSNNITQSEVTDGLVGKWMMDGDVEDTSGNNYDLTNNNATLTTDEDGNADSAYDFVPANSAWLSRSPFNESMRTEVFSFKVRFKGDAWGNGNILFGNAAIATFASGMALSWHTGNLLKFWVNATATAGYFASKSFTDTGSWHTAICTFKKANASQRLKFYLDSHESPATADYVNGSVPYVGTVFTIGKGYGSGSAAYWDGKISVVKFWDKELSASEVELEMSN